MHNLHDLLRNFCVLMKNLLVVVLFQLRMKSLMLNDRKFKLEKFIFSRVDENSFSFLYSEILSVSDESCGGV